VRKRLKYFVLTLFISAFIMFVVHLTLFENLYTYKSISNAIFVVALMMFFVSLISITDADKIFRIAVYSFKSIRRKTNKKYKTYYDYAKDKENEKLIPFAIEMMLLSILYFGIAYYLSQRYFETL